MYRNRFGINVSTAAVFCGLIMMLCASICAADPPWIYGMHDNGAESIGVAQGKQIWVLMTELIGHDPNNTSGDALNWLTDPGHGALVRLNNGYGDVGTIPTSDQYDNFATRCANFVAHSPGPHIWLIGNEMNLLSEAPGGTVAITPQTYATCFLKCRTAIKAVPGHETDWVLPGAVGPQGLPSINWFNTMVASIGSSNIDGFAIHCYTGSNDPNLVFSNQKDGNGYFYQFRAYRDFMTAIPSDSRTKPVFITETCPGGQYAWTDVDNGWVKNVYSEINTWNNTAGKQLIRGVCLYRWPAYDQYGIQNKPNVIKDWTEAMAYDYRWNTAIPTGTNIAGVAKTVQTDSNYSSSYDGSKALDGSVSTKWCTANTAAPHWLALDFGAKATINGYIVRLASTGSDGTNMNAKTFTIQTADSISGPWTDSILVDNSAQASVITKTYGTSIFKRCVRLYITNTGIDNYARIPEFEVWGTATAPDIVPPTVANIVPTPACVKTNGNTTVTATVTDDVSISSSGIYLPMPTNLLANPGFENSATGWTNTSNPNFSHNNGYPGASPKDGSSWIGSSCAWAGGVKTPELRQVLNVTPGAKYFASVWVTTDGSPNACSSYLQWMNGAATADGQCTNIAYFTDNTSGGWKQLYGIISPTGTQLTYALKLSWDCGGSGGGGNFDLAELRLLQNPTTYSGGTATWSNVAMSTSYAFPIYAVDDAGNVTFVTSPTTVTFDDIAPNSFTPTASPSAWTNGNVSVSFSTTDTGCSGMGHYEIAIDGGAYTTQTSPYTMTQTGTHTVHVKALDNAGNSIIRDVSTYIDTTPPTTPSITAPNRYVYDTTQLSASWTSADPESGITEYQYAVGTTWQGTDVVNWTSTGTTASFSKTGLSLQYGQWYWISVKAKNGAGQWSGLGSNNGVRVARTVSTIAEAKGYADSSDVRLIDKPVTGSSIATVMLLGPGYWIEETDRSAGIRIVGWDTVGVPGTRLTVTGTLMTFWGERYLDKLEFSQNGTMTVPNAVAMNNVSIGGRDMNANTPGVRDGIGLNNIGLLITTWGRVTQIGTGYLYIDDGSGITDGTKTGTDNNIGVRIVCTPASYSTGDFLVVTGFSSCFANPNNDIVRQILTRGPSDIFKPTAP